MSQLKDHEMVMHVVIPVSFATDDQGNTVQLLDSEKLLQAQAKGVVGCNRCDAGFDEAKQMPCVPVAQHVRVDDDV